MDKPLIHIGYHKTGTTWLQKVLFPCDAAGFTAAVAGQEILEWLVLPNALDFDAAACRARFQPALERAFGAGLLPVISSERLSGNPHSGGYDSRELANRIAAVFPEARVFLAIREQKSMALSVYKQYVRGGGTCSLQDYLRPPTRGRERVPLFDFAHFQYDRLIRYYHELFGAANVLALPYEMFRETPADFVRKLIDFSAAPATDIDALPFERKSNEALSPFLIEARRRLNRFDERDSLNPSPLFPGLADKLQLHRVAGKWNTWVSPSRQKALDQQMKATLEKVLDEATIEQYRRSNQLTARLIGIDLAPYGYMM